MQPDDILLSDSSRLNNIRVLSRCLLSIYNAVTIPLRFAFIPDFEINLSYSYQYGAFIVIDLLSNIFFLIDAIIIFYYDNKVQIEPMHTATSVSHRGSFIHQGNSYKGRCSLIASIFSCIPLEYVTLMPIGDDMVVNYLIINRVIRIFYIPSYIEDFSFMLEYKGITKSSGIQRAWKLFFIMALAGHLCCCGFFFVAKVEAAYGTELTWIEELELIQSDEDGDIEMLVSVAEAYIQALYWAYITMVSHNEEEFITKTSYLIHVNISTQITTGFGDIVPLSISETIWCIFTMLLGVMITACAIANLQLVFTNVDAALTNFQGKLETVSKYMRYRHLPNDLQNRVTSFYHYQWDLLRGADEERFLSELPKSLQQQVSNFMCRDLIAALPVLRKANTALLNALTDCAEVNIYSPNDDILKYGEQIRGTLLLSRGEVEVLTFHGKVERKMKRCDTFAEESLFVKKVCDKNVRAKTFSEVFMLPSDAFQQIVEAQCDKNQIDQMRDIAVTITKNSKKANKLFGSGEDDVPMNSSRRKFHPNSSFRAIWDLLCLFGYLFYVFSLPLMMMRFLDGKTFQDNLVEFMVSYAVDFFFVINLYLRFNCFMYYEEGLVIFDRERIRNRFIKEHRIIWELMILVPIDFLGLVMETRWCFLFRLSKFFRLPQILKIVDDFNRHLSNYKIGGDMVLFKVIKLNFILLIVCHWVGTMWHGCADLSQQLGFTNNWRRSDEDDETLSISHSDFGGFSGYLRSVYWAIVGMSTTGYGDIVPTNFLETTFATVVILFGGLILPAVVGGLAAYLANVNLTRKNYRRKLGAAKSYMKHCMMDKGLINRVTSYYDYLWSRQDAIDEESIMNEFPWPLRQQVAIHLHRIQIDAVPFFENCEDSVKQLIVSILKPRIFMPMDIVIHKGEIGTSMYFIEKGEVAIIAENGMAFCVLEKGDYFGESSLISTAVLTSSAKALTYCDVFVLQKEDFQGVMEEFVSLDKQKNITERMMATMKKKLKLNGNITHNLTHHPKCSTLVSMIDTTQVRKGEDGQIKGTSGVLPSRVPYYPGSKFLLMWNAIMVISYVYNAWTVPFRLAFKTEPSYWLDSFFDCLLVLDMYLNYCKFAFLREGEFVDDVERVKSNYILNRLKLDIISILPYDAIYHFIVRSGHSPIVKACLRASKLFLTVRLPQLLSSILTFLEDANVNIASFRLVEFLSGVVLIAHWAACGFYAFARLKNDELTCLELHNNSDILMTKVKEVTECRWKNTWIQRQIMNGKIPHNGGTIWQRYIRSFNWALPTLVVVVIGDVVPVTSSETLYALIWMILGVTINAAIIGNVANIVANIDTDSSIFIKRADEIKKFMHEVHISNGLQSRVSYFLTSLWEHRESLIEDSFVNELPSTLRIQVTQKTRQRHISECPFFDFCSYEIVKALSLCLKLLMFSKDDIIVHAGDMGREMFFLEKGTVEILSDDGETVFATLGVNTESIGSLNQKASTFFGETSLFFKQRRTNTVRASSFCEVYELRKRDLDRELRQRDFDLSRMLEVFTKIANRNKQRNQAVATNLKLSRSKNSKLFKVIGSNIAISTTGRKTSPHLNPNSNFRKIWDILYIVLIIYLVIAIPFRAVFCYEDLSAHLPRWLFFDFCIDGFFIIDFYFRCYLFPVSYNGSILTEKEQIRLRYKQNGMICDLLACVPFELLSIWLGTHYLLQFRLLHMIRILNLPIHFIQAESYLNLYNVRFSAATKLLLNMFFYYTLVNHWCACIWFAIHRFFEPNTKYTWATTDCPDGDDFASRGCLSVWLEDIQAHNVCDQNMIRRCYIRSVYFVLTTTSTVGYGKPSNL